MERDPKVWVVAESLVAQHREEAVRIAQEQARERVERGDSESQRVWLQVADTAEVLLRCA